jgi:radical SAM superfamily enzyme YgiQ (UPF0313 family)
MKVLVTHSYFISRDPKQLKAGKPYPPLAPLYALALLREQGIEVAFADLQFSSPQDITTHILKFCPDVLVIYDDAFNYLVKMCLTNMREAVFSMMEIAKQHQIPVVVSSSDATDHQDLYFKKGTDFLLLGEAEQTLLELVNALESKSSVTAIEGLAYTTGSGIEKTPARRVSKQLDELPMPAWDLLDLKPYREAWLKSTGYFSMNLVTTRGCPYKCNWCAKPVYGNRYNSHGAKRVAQEMKLLKERYGVQHIWFADDIFGLKPNFLSDLNEELTKIDCHLPFKIQSRADLIYNEVSVRLLAAAGCEEVWMGVESGSQRILDAMDKGITIEQIEVARANLKRHCIRVGFFMQFGYSGETAADLKLSLNLLERLQPDDLGVSVSYPLPGTVFYERVKQDLKTKQNWSDSDDLQIMFQSSYSADFYKALQKFVHYRFRKTQALTHLKQNTINRSTLLLPYYVLREKSFKKRLYTFAPEAADILN